MLDDILKAARQQISERLTSPILGSFVIAWCLWNYRFLVILLSAASVSTTFELIDKSAFPDSSTVWLRGILFPILSSAAYIFLYPYPARFVYGFSLRRLRETNQLRQQIEDETLLSAEESRRIRTEVIVVEDRHRGELDRLNQEVARLREQLDASTVSTERTDAAPQIPEKDVKRLTPSQLAILKLISEGNTRVVSNDIINRSREHKVKTEFDLGELERMGLIKQARPLGADSEVCSLTHEGRRVLIENSNH